MILRHNHSLVDPNIYTTINHYMYRGEQPVQRGNELISPDVHLALSSLTCVSVCTRPDNRWGTIDLYLQ